ncbi:porin [Thauera sp.]|uniref:porin n=1 Tax=Thauera sp. TaxID=1905334 RepID=UPI002A3724AA|nr:porin [Thauera sp.]MDX9886667.1 porin [Thauera sp.]
MQKKLIALAVAGLVSAPAFAQSNVTIYGVADAYMAFGDHGDNDMGAINSGGLSGSRLGFRGVEDLGNGLKAVFTFEQGYNVDDGTGLGGNSRQSFVGLSGGFGTVSLGRQYAPGYDFIADSFGSSPILSPQAILSGAVGSTIDASSDARWNNSVAYNGAFSGLKVRAIYSMDADVSGRSATEVGTDPYDDDALGLGLDYSNGPLRVAAVYQYLKDGVGSATSDDQTEWSVGGSYNFGILTLAANYQDYEAVGNLSGNDGDIWQVGVVVPVGAAGNVHLGYGELDADLADAKAKSYSIAYTHALSKRTTAYAGYNRTDNDTGLNIGVVPAPAGVTGEEADVFAVGVRHTF